MSASREARVGERVKVAGGRFDERTGRVEGIRSPDEALFGTSPIAGLVDEPMALVKFDTVYGDGLDAVGIPLRRCKPLS
jgi:hypothetical protein